MEINSQVSGVTYDSLGRLATIGFGATAANPTAYTSSATLTWDSGNRLTTIVDVQSGRTTTIKRTFDGLDRMTKEVTDQGEVDYTYDPAGRRQTLTVKNGPVLARVAQPQITYTWDDADRLSLISQAAGASNNNVVQTVGFGYDDANRLGQATYTGGQSTNYTYTDADEVQSITYKTPSDSVIATGTYTYDAVGHRSVVSGDLAAYVKASGTDVTDAVYNANNQLTTWSGKTFGYDKNGNLKSDGTNIYQWDARDQLTGMTGGSTVSFQYDSQRRRIAKTIAGSTTAYAYDGDNFVQELATTGTSGAIKANLLTGDTDQLFMRSVSGSGTTATLSWVLPEANNNTLIPADGAGAIKQTYAYEPYGATTPSGTDTNTQQYTGRENDGTGLYYYRNRYYMPGCMRFVSEDPIGWASGQGNNYAYAYGNPVQFGDPSGLFGAADMPTLPSWLVNFSAGFGDTLSFSLTSLARSGMDIGGVDPCSGSYLGGEVAGTALGIAMGSAGAARGGLRVEMGNWKQAGEWAFPQGTKALHFHWGQGAGLQSHHLPYQASSWLRNFMSLAQRGKAAQDIQNLVAVGLCTAIAAEGLSGIGGGNGCP